MRGSELASMAVAMTLASAPPQLACAPHEAVDRQLSEKYGERPHAIGLTAMGWMMQLYRATDGSTWTLLLTRPDGLSCLAEHGTGLEPVPAEEGPGA